VSIISGGAYCAPGSFNTTRDSVNSPQTAYAGQLVTKFNDFIQPADDPKGRGYNVLKCRINQSAYDAHPSLGDPYSTWTLRAEVNVGGGVTYSPWGSQYTYYGRFIPIPPGGASIGASADVVVFQLHEVAGPVAPHEPAFSIHLLDSTLVFRQWTTGISSNDFYSLPVVAGQEVEIFARITWADGTHVAAANGVYEWTVNGVQVYTSNGIKNTWDDSGSEISPPALRVGVYQSNNGAAWWVGKEWVTHHVAVVIGDSSESVASLRAYVDAQIAAHPNKRVVAAY